MSELNCSCGGVFRPLGREFIRTGEVSRNLLGGPGRYNDWEEESIPGELFACDQCRCLRFCADEAWIAERIAYNERAEEKKRETAEWEARTQEKRVQEAMETMARHKVEKLQKIVDGDTWNSYADWEKEAARRLLEQKKAQAQQERWKDWN